MKKCVFIILMLVCLRNTQAQFSLSKNFTKYKPQVNQKQQAHKSSLDLPFLDDFSNYKGNPDLSLWLDTGGVYINNESAILPPTQGVVTFDGVDANGNPYEFSDVVNEAVGLADQLISDSINLASLSVSNEVYLSFFWQREGRGERPNEEDSLRLEFKDENGEWKRVWSTIGGEPSNDFEQVLIRLDNEGYFFEKFQFRFQAYGRLSGLYDAWHVDYVYLDSGRSSGTFYSNDLAPTENPSNFLANYTAMPINQYLVNPVAETNTEIFTQLNNLSNELFDTYNYEFTINNLNSATELFSFTTAIAPTINGLERQDISVDISGFTFPSTLTEGIVLESRFEFNTGDTDLDIPPIDLTKNDTIISQTSLEDYYAYDDGSAEYGAGVNQRFGRVAIEFNLNEKDTLTDALIHITKLEKDLTGQTFIFTVWKEIGASDSVLLQIGIPITYADTRNGFVSIKQLAEESFSNFPPLALEGRFYVGWEQTTNDRMTVGYDRNNDFSSRIFFNTGNQWLQWQAPPDETGSLMLRPVFGETETITGLEDSTSKDFIVYPNPTNQYLHFEGETPKAIYIFDLRGKLVFESRSPQKVLNLATLSQGLYILKADFGNKDVITKKIVIKH